MTEENKVEETKAEVVEDTSRRGPRGEVGKATTALTLKQRWHASHFKRVDVGDKSNPRKRIWVPMPKAPSLKQFAKQLLASGDPDAKEWFAHKKGSLNQKRSDANVARIALESQATKNAKRKSGACKGKGGKATAAPAA